MSDPGSGRRSGAKAFEAGRRKEIAHRLKAGKGPTITLGAAAKRYYETRCFGTTAGDPEALRDALEQAGVRFIGANRGGGTGHERVLPMVRPGVLT